FTLAIRAKANVQLSEILKIGDAVTPREAYGTVGTLEDVALQFNTVVAQESPFVLYQNQPNPFRDETVIGFELPEGKPATVKITDVTGRTLRVYPVDGVKGYNQITVSASDLGATGILSYTVMTEDYSATKQMIVVE
ncbi:MAG: T9SS type A sorting domain-containing protein, partial [Phaeodactylibacter sp.]|nr:T9SS type A sorting domain-containing protein [Phaeodactylibacter sp.]